MVGGSSLSGCSNPESKTEAATPPPLPVKVQPAENGTLKNLSEFVGTLEAAERVALQPQTNGRVQQVFVASGDRISQGSPVLSLSVDQAQANVGQAQAKLNSDGLGLIYKQVTAPLSGVVGDFNVKVGD